MNCFSEMVTYVNTNIWQNEEFFSLLVLLVVAAADIKFHSVESTKRILGNATLFETPYHFPSIMRGGGVKGTSDPAPPCVYREADLGYPLSLLGVSRTLVFID